MRTSRPTDFEEAARSASRLIFTDFQKAEEAIAALGALLDGGATPAARANWHFLRGQFDNEKYQFEAAAEQFTTAIRILEKGGDRQLLADARLELAAVLTNLGQLEQAEETLALTRSFIKKNGDPLLTARLTGRDAFLKLHEGNRDLALAQLLDAQRLMAKLPGADEPRELAFRTRIENGLFEIHLKNGDPESAVAAALDALRIAEPNGLRTRISWLYLNAGRAFDALDRDGEATIYFEKAAAAKDDVHREARGSATANLACYCLKRGQLDEAETGLARALELYGEPKRPVDFSNHSIVETWLAQLFLIKRMDSEAEVHIQKAIAHGEKGSNIGQLAELCRVVADYYAQNGEFEKAYNHMRRADELARVKEKQSSAENLHEIKIKYDADNRRHEAEQARSQTVILQLSALRAQMNPHFMFNVFNSVQSFIVTGQAKDAGRWFAQFSRLIRSTLELSKSETISLEEEVDFLRSYLEINQKMRFPGKLTFEIIADEDLETDFIKIPTMIVQPYVENAIEHGIKPRGGGHIRIVFAENDDQTLTCTVEDDGFGLREMLRRHSENPENRSHRSRGREITEERLAILHRSAGRKVGEWVRTSDLSDGPEAGKTGTRVDIFIPEI